MKTTVPILICLSCFFITGRAQNSATSSVNIDVGGQTMKKRVTSSGTGDVMSSIDASYTEEGGFKVDVDSDGDEVVEVKKRSVEVKKRSAEVKKRSVEVKKRSAVSQTGTAGYGGKRSKMSESGFSRQNGCMDHTDTATCQFWADRGECSSSSSSRYMLLMCRASCGVCDTNTGQSSTTAPQSGKPMN